MVEDARARSGLTAFRLTLSVKAARDLNNLLAFSRKRFGEISAERYEALIFAALVDVRNDPGRPGVRMDDRLQTGIRLYHLRSASRQQRSVRSPRHWIAFKVHGDHIRVVRVLHESMDLPSYLR